MNLNIPFPTPKEKLALEAAEYVRCSPEEKIEALIELSLLCEDILAASPASDEQIRLLDQNERLEHQRWREVIERHVEQERPKADPV